MKNMTPSCFVKFYCRLCKFYNISLFCSPWSALSTSFQSRRSQSPPLGPAVDDPQMIRPQDYPYYYLNDSLLPYTDLKPYWQLIWSFIISFDFYSITWDRNFILYCRSCYDIIIPQAKLKIWHRKFTFPNLFSWYT